MVNPVPERFHSIVASLSCTPCADAIDFYCEAFDAEEVEPRMTGPDGRIGHAELRIAGSVIMLADEWPDGPVQSPTTLGGSTCGIMLYSEDAERLWDQAVAAGAEVTFPLEMQFYGDLSGRLRDPFGHSWGIARQVEVVPADQMQARMAEFYQNLDD